VAAVRNCDLPEAIRWARRWLGIEDGKPEPRRRSTPPPKPPAVVRIDDAKAKAARALEIWTEALDSIVDTPAEAYLRGRGFDPAGLVSLWSERRWPATLRYSERAALDPGRLCRALIVAVHGADCGRVSAIQRILLHPDGTAVLDDKGRKRKLSLGPIAGNAAMFDYEPDPAGRWGIAEGCETALAAYALTGIPAWAAISAGNMANVTPPSWARHATIFADRDEAGLAAAGEALLCLQEIPTLKTVRVWGPRTEGQDMADLLPGGHRHAV
jgi:hypothetical protein